MSDANEYVSADEHGALRVGKSRVMLDSILAGWTQGHSPETIRAQYPALALNEVYGAITWCLSHRGEVDEYIRKQDALWQQWKRRSEANPSPFGIACEPPGSLRGHDEPPAVLADHDLNEHIIDGLLRREPAIEIWRARDHGLQEAPDTELLAFPATQNLLVISHDVNTMPAAAYARIAAGDTLPGLLMVSQSLPMPIVLDNLTLIWSASEAEEWDGQVWFLPI